MTLKTNILNFFRLFSKIKFIEQILCNYTQGKSLGSLITRIPANYYQYPSLSIRKVKRDGIWFELDISDYMEWLIYFGILVEPRKKLYDLIRNKSVIIDIGGNIGETTLNFAKFAGKKANVYSFEPDSKCYEKLMHNISLNNFENIKVFNFGLGDVDAKYYLASDSRNNKGGNKIHLNITEEHNIVVKRLDDVVKEEQIFHVDFIKIDVEGFEYRVLKGAEEIIKNDRPILFIELDENNLKAQGTSGAALISFLETYYSSIENASTGEQINSGFNFNNCHFDIVAH